MDAKPIYTLFARDRHDETIRIECETRADAERIANEKRLLKYTLISGNVAETYLNLFGVWCVWSTRDVATGQERITG